MIITHASINSVIDFKKEFEMSILEIQHSLMQEINLLYDEDNVECEVKRISDIYLDIIFDAATKHQESGADIDKCLMDELDSAPCQHIDLVLSVALFYSCKCGYHYKKGQMNYSLADLKDANYYLGIHRGYCASIANNKYERMEFFQGAASKRHSENRENKHAAINDYITNYAGKLKGLKRLEASKIKNQAAEEIARKYGLEYRTVRNDYIDSYHKENTPS